MPHLKVVFRKWLSQENFQMCHRLNEGGVCNACCVVFISGASVCRWRITMTGINKLCCCWDNVVFFAVQTFVISWAWCVCVVMQCVFIYGPVLWNIITLWCLVQDIGVGDAKPVVADVKLSFAPAGRRDSGSDVETDPFFDDLQKKDTTQ